MAFDTRSQRIYLASRSPRRRELLTQIGIQFDTLFFREPPRQDDDVDESAHEGEARRFTSSGSPAPRPSTAGVSCRCGG